MKKILLLTLGIVALAMSAQAGIPPTAITLSTNRLVAATTNTTAGTGFPIGGYNRVNVGLTCYSTNAAVGAGDAAATLTVHFQGSIDNVTYYDWGTNLDVTITPGATNATSVLAVLDASSFFYLKPTKMSWNSTNLVIFPSMVYFTK